MYLGDLAVVRLDGRHSEQVPEGAAVLAVVQQPHRARNALLHRVPDDLHLFRVCALALQEATAQAGVEGVRL